MAMMAAESGTMSLQDLALLVAGITAMQAEVTDLTDETFADAPWPWFHT
jgi:hypothetical protein